MSCHVVYDCKDQPGVYSLNESCCEISVRSDRASAATLALLRRYSTCFLLS